LSTDEFVRASLLCSSFKKSEIESAETAECETFEAFLAANRFCGCQSLQAFRDWDGSPSVGYSIATAREFLFSWFEQQSLDDPAITMARIECAARFGPGRSVGLGDKPSLLYFKVGDSAQTAGSEFIRSWYESSVLYNPVCEAAEMARQARHGRAEVQMSGNLSFVPKSYQKRRIVVTEPSLSTYFQLGLGECMEDVLRRNTGIDLSTQSVKNAELARIGSIDGSYATMDLTQCSDYISLALVEYMFPPSLVRWIKILRTGSVRLPDKSVLALDMVSTMGNGFTFPLQTVLLTSLVLGVYDTLGIKSEFGVFGDDIAIDQAAYDLLVRVLTELGLKVNLAKSFNAGPFRESCGHDYYYGHECRGVYLKRYASDQDLFSCFNRLSLWSAQHQIPLQRTLTTILSILTEDIPLIPPDESVDAGIIVPNPIWDADENGCWSYHAFARTLSSLCIEPWDLIEIGCLFHDGRRGNREMRKLKRWIGDLQRFCGGDLNSPALLKSILAGGLRRGRFAFRESENPKFRRVERSTPRWGYSPDGNFPLVGSICFETLDQMVRCAIATVLV
jgi:hypothetical protein